ncbi:hypothetical protein [Nocardioides sp. AE5]|uniref:hypothetical protein n=1 Tax=Nocardioides sp. AE5 TaxID=2962573 RepID=UPI0028816359|nr:hypothetical protein [Nocardioides sp. AE5]MDT0201077.1 hypothetical protein [Nocardioides sp. AE5]
MPITQPSHDPAALAGHARSILAAPSAVDLVVEGAAYDLSEGVTVQDDCGIPTFLAPIDSVLDRAASQASNALLRISSDLAPGDESVILAGRLRLAGGCAHQQVVRVITLEIGLVTLVSTSNGAERHTTVPTREFRSPAHRLNAGYLRGTMAHANECHQDELRQAVAMATGQRVGNVLGVAVHDLTPSGLRLSWLEPEGGHMSRIDFPRPARDPEELAALLSSHLHSGIC